MIYYIYDELGIYPYPKGDSKKYDSGKSVETQGLLFG